MPYARPRERSALPRPFFAAQKHGESEMTDETLMCAAFAEVCGAPDRT
ncbi:hypothetical protein HMPREF1546_01843 [Oscillibacter sp. KLE 1745]|nr:hypothetical protein HMPREF1546_01843 [Oscillibacter sp. KLE 1745]